MITPEAIRTLDTPASENVARIEYDVLEKEALVTFKSGAKYMYEGVSLEDFGAVAGASSIGSVFNRIFVKGDKKSRKVDV